ncbi:LysR family transcriptional regulator [Methylibium sp.]|uniref:LysR family transcriptional regulator n=1 Tax=Methylibium sp. TaxID=2067992 RepID=UPI003D0C2581
MDRFLAMQTFVRVADAGSFSAVARELGSTQSAISKQVAALERHLGASLLTRSTRHLALTEAGQRYLEEARRLVAEVSEAEAVVRRGEQQLSGLLRVAASVGYGRTALMPQVKSFLAAHPDVRIDLRLDDGFIDLVERGIDVAVRIGELADSSLVARRIGTTHRALMASRRYVEGLPRALRTLRSPADLAHHNCIVYTELAVRDAWQFDGPGGASATVRVKGNLQSNSSEVVRAAVLSDMGVCYSPTWLFDKELASGDVRRLMTGWPLRPLPVHLVSPLQLRHSAKVRAFGEHVAKGLAEALDRGPTGRRADTT